MVSELFDGLAIWDENGHPAPGLAERWEASPDMRTWTFHLRDGARWSNGRSIEADDFRWHVARMLHPATQAPWSWLLHGIRGARQHSAELDRSRAPLDLASLQLPDSVGVRAPDERTVVIEFDQPTPWAARLLAAVYLRPAPREMLGTSASGSFSPDNLITSGPFRLQSIDAERVVLEKSTSYWNADEVRLDRVTLRSTPETESVARFRAGECEVATNVGPSAETEPEYEHHPHPGIYLLVLNVEKLPNRHLRRALAMSVDRASNPFLDRALDTCSSFTPTFRPDRLHAADRKPCAELSTGLPLVSSPFSYCYDPPAGLAYDPAAARKELARARVSRGAWSGRSIQLAYNAGVEGHQVTAEHVQAGWVAALGVEVSLRVEEWREFLRHLTAGDYEVARMGWIGAITDPLADFLPTFRCGAPTNKARWCNEAYDRLLDEALAETSPARRLSLARSAETILLEEAVVIPLFSYAHRWLRRPDVRGMQLNLTDQRPLSAAYIAEPLAAP